MSVTRFRFPFVEMPAEATQLRQEVREFLTQERANGGYTPMADCWAGGMCAEFSHKIGKRGRLGMTCDQHYARPGRSYLERYVVT